MNKKLVSWELVNASVNNFKTKNKKDYSFTLAVARGGIPVAMLLGGRNIKIVEPFTDVSNFKDHSVLIVDDIKDTGATIEHFKKQLPNADVFTAFEKKDNSTWYVFPWETGNDTAGGLRQACTAILRGVGEDPMREGLKETPERFDKAWRYWTKGYRQKPGDIMKMFENETKGIDQLIAIPQIDFYSMCEHHMAPFYGQVYIGYVPNGKILGISKFARLTEIYARRLQVQERMTDQIAQAIMKYLKPQGVGVVVKGIHLCMRSRGVEKQNTEMLTSSMFGKFRTVSDLRSEFLSVLNI